MAQRLGVAGALLGDPATPMSEMQLTADRLVIIGTVSTGPGPAGAAPVSGGVTDDVPLLFAGRRG